MLLIPLGTALEFNSGEVNELFEIPVCYNEAKIRVTSLEKPVERSFKIINCTKVDNNNWVCPCTGESLKINFYTRKRTLNTYDFLIHYQTKDFENIPINITEGPTWEQQQYEAYTRNTRINKVEVKPEGFVINPDLTISIRNAIMFSILIVLSILGFIFFKKKDNFKIKDNEDVLGYNYNEDEISDILNEIK